MYNVFTAEYAQVLRMLGNGRLEAMCIDSTKRLCHIRGKMRKKVWVNTVSGAALLYLAVCRLLRNWRSAGCFRASVAQT